PTLALRTLIDDRDGFTSKSGNVPSAKAYGLKANTSIRLGFIGLKDAVVGLSYKYEKKQSNGSIHRQ
ncbi:MAG: hypothetical protein P8I94_02565, partial [Emcibacteraceae bacterium]|nr:hypothetical protein [Emcibacteraceae bacterium]